MVDAANLRRRASLRPPNRGRGRHAYARRIDHVLRVPRAFAGNAFTRPYERLGRMEREARSGLNLRADEGRVRETTAEAVARQPRRAGIILTPVRQTLTKAVLRENAPARNHVLTTSVAAVCCSAFSFLEPPARSSQVRLTPFRRSRCRPLPSLPESTCKRSTKHLHHGRKRFAAWQRLCGGCRDQTSDARAALETLACSCSLWF